MQTTQPGPALKLAWQLEKVRVIGRRDVGHVRQNGWLHSVGHVRPGRVVVMPEMSEQTVEVPLVQGLHVPEQFIIQCAMKPLDHSVLPRALVPCANAPDFHAGQRSLDDGKEDAVAVHDNGTGKNLAVHERIA